MNNITRMENSKIVFFIWLLSVFLRKKFFLNFFLIFYQKLSNLNEINEKF